MVHHCRPFQVLGRTSSLNRFSQWGFLVVFTILTHCLDFIFLCLTGWCLSLMALRTGTGWSMTWNRGDWYILFLLQQQFCLLVCWRLYWKILSICLPLLVLCVFLFCVLNFFMNPSSLRHCFARPVHLFQSLYPSKHLKEKEKPQDFQQKAKVLWKAKNCPVVFPW